MSNATRVGEAICFSGYASDYDRRIVAVEFSLDDGEHWTRYETPNTESKCWVNWNFEFTPKRAGVYLLQVRSVNEFGQQSPTPVSIQFEVA